MEWNQRVIQISIVKKASFDGKSYIIRLPAEIVRFMQQRNIPVENIVVEGVWEPKEGVFYVLLIFGEKSAEQNLKADNGDSDDEVKENQSYDESKEPDKEEFVDLTDRFR